MSRALDLHQELIKAQERYRKSHTPLSEKEWQHIEDLLQRGDSVGEVMQATARSERSVRKVKRNLAQRQEMAAAAQGRKQP